MYNTIVSFRDTYSKNKLLLKYKLIRGMCRYLSKKEVGKSIDEKCNLK